MPPLSRPLAAAAIAALSASIAGCGPSRACREGQAAAPQRAAPSAVAGQRIHAHAHNDYEHPRPLLDALAERFYSVEADVYFDGGRFRVAHGGWDAEKGTLKDLYLDPLQVRVNEAGSVHGDGEPFTLWVDLKDNDSRAPEALRALLDQYPMLSRFTDTSETAGPVRVILTGDAAAKAAVVDAPDRRAVRDSNDYTPDDPPADLRWRAYALSWGKVVSWNGEGDAPAEAMAQLACVCENARADGRVVRLYGGPDRPEAWRAQLEAGVDFINTDKLGELHAFLAGEP